jgi:protein TonB
MATFAILVGFLVVVGLLLTYDTTWMSVFQDQRNNLVFATRNKVYGAFELRQDYSRRLGFAMLGAVAFFGVVVGTPYLISKLGPADEAQEKVNIVEVNLDNFSEDKPEEPPPPPEVIPPPQPQIETVQFTAVEASDEPVEAPPPTQEDLKETTASTTTQEGEKIDAPPPPPPVEEVTYDLAAVQEQPEFSGGMAEDVQLPEEEHQIPGHGVRCGHSGQGVRGIRGGKGRQCGRRIHPARR